MTSLSPSLDGVLLVDKAEGMTSHDVVALVRRKIEIKKVGHCGTLDPIATGLLLFVIRISSPRSTRASSSENSWLA